MRSRSDPELVSTARDLAAGGVGRQQLRAELDSGRWRRRAGPGIVLHNGPLSRPQQFRVAQAHAGPRAIFTAAEILGLTG
jgi:hypothetical protein